MYPSLSSGPMTTVVSLPRGSFGAGFSFGFSSAFGLSSAAPTRRRTAKRNVGTIAFMASHLAGVAVAVALLKPSALACDRRSQARAAPEGGPYRRNDLQGSPSRA